MKSSLLLTLTLTVALLIGIEAKAEVTMTKSGRNITFTSTDTTGVSIVPDWNSNTMEGDYNTPIVVTVNFQVRRGTKMNFDWSITGGWNWEKVTVALDGTTLSTGTYESYSTSVEKLFKKEGSHKLTITYTKYWGTLYLSNFKLDHEAGKGPDGMLPFHPTTIDGKGNFGSDVVWYSIYMTSSKKYLYVDGDEVLVSTDMKNDPAYYWTMTRDGEDHFRIYNMATGTSKPMTLTGRTQRSPIVMDADGTDNSFLLADNGEGYTLWVDGDTCTMYVYSNQLMAYHPTTIWKTYNTTTTTRMMFNYVGTPHIAPITDIMVNDVYILKTNNEGSTSYYKSDDNKQVTVDEGDKVEISWEYNPEDTSEPDVSLSVDNTSVLQVQYQELNNRYAIYSTKTGGEATITIQSTKRPEVKTDFHVTVVGKVRLESINLDTDSISMKVGGMHPIGVQLLPSNAYDNTITWSNSKPSVATISGDGTVYALSPGKTILTARANDGGGATAKLIVTVTEPVQNESVEHDRRYLYALHSDSSLTAIPQSYVESKTYAGTTLSLHLSGGLQEVLKDVTKVSEDCPVALPYFTSYKFNNKFNDQLFTDAVAAETDLQNDTITIPVGCIGKRLTASFQLADDSLACVWVDSTRQFSKHTRQRFDKPITYTIGHANWKALRLVKHGNDVAVERIPFGTQTTVTVDWLTDRSSTTMTVPRIDIKFGDENAWSSSQWIGHNGKETYIDATIKINGGGVFPSLDTTPIQIKGRGNTSWSSNYRSKNPYHFKFASKQKPLGMTAGKHWILLANKISGSMTTNAIAHRAAALLDMAAPCHIIPVELYINGSYRGSYNLTERVALANNSVALDNDSLAAIIEMDTYTDEAIINESSYYLPIKLKSPDDTLTLHSDAEAAFETLTRAVYQGKDYDNLVDIDRLASFIVTNELIANCEIKHPKSVFAYNENLYDCDTSTLNDPTPWVFGPLWDCDWAFGYQQTSAYFTSNTSLDYFEDMGNSDYYGSNPQRFWKALRYGSEALDRAVYSRMYHFITQGGLDELIEYCDDYYAFAQKSLAHNKQNETSDADATSYATTTTKAKTWLTNRASHLFSRYQTYDLSDDDDAYLHPTDKIGDISANGTARSQSGTFDLQGRRVTGTLQPGIYIRNGKKVFVK